MEKNKHNYYDCTIGNCKQCDEIDNCDDCKISCDDLWDCDDCSDGVGCGRLCKKHNA